MEESALGCGVEVDVVAERGERVVDEAAVVVDVARIVRDDPRNLPPLGEVDERAGKRALDASGVMELDFDGETFAEHVAPFVEQAPGVGAVSAADERRDWPGRRPGERDEPGTQLGHFAPCDVRPAAPLLAVLLGPARPRAHAAACDERREVAVALGGAHEERGGPAVDAQLGPDDRPELATRPCCVDESRDAAQVCRVGDAERGVA